VIVAGLVVRGAPTQSQVMGIAWGRFISSVGIVTPVFVYLLIRMAGLSVRDFTAAIAPSAIASVTVIGSVAALRFLAPAIDVRPALSLAVQVAAGGIVGLIALLCLDVGLRASVVALLQRVFKMQAASYQI
jgi:hypothetical protein